MEVDWNYRSYTQAEFKEAWCSSSSMAECIRKLGILHAGANYKSIKQAADSLGLTDSHFSSKSRRVKSRKYTVEDLVEGSTITGVALRRLLIESGVQYECSCCGISEWNGVKLTLHVDHVNGVRTDNRIGNLRFLCPNCHSLTPTFGSKNQKRRFKKINTCNDCGIEVSRKAARCYTCAKAAVRSVTHKGDRRADLIDTLQSVNWNFCAAGRRYGISDNAVRKRCKSVGLPTTRESISEYLDN